MSSAIKINPDWLAHLENEFAEPYMQTLKQFLQQEKSAGKTIYPPSNDIFNALNTTAIDSVKVVILGQDPYHGPDQAHGLSFSVRKGVALPPSLLNIYKEIGAEYNVTMPRIGDLTPWAKQGVLLLNATLTVEHGLANSHQGRGWERFTDAVIRHVDAARENVVFMLWGSYAQKKGAFINRKKHLVLEAPHPSPLSAHRGFMGCGHFRKANDYLVEKGVTPIEWTNITS